MRKNAPKKLRLSPGAKTKLDANPNTDGENQEVDEVQSLLGDIGRLEDENKKLRSELKATRRGSTLFGLLSDTIQRQPPFSTFTPYSSADQKKGKIKESAILVLSDSHGDQEILSKRVQGLEEYNFDVACLRAERIVDTTVSHLIDNMKNYKFERLYIAGLGDYVNGDIHNATEHSKWRNSLKNSMGMGELIAMMITDLSRYFPEIVFCSVSGNHGRRSYKKDYRGAHDNWDYLVGMHVATRLNKLVEENRVRIILPDAWSMGLSVYDWNFVLNHGDDIRCFLPGARVSLSDGTFKAIESIQCGDMVLCSDGTSRKIEEVMEYDHDGEVVHLSAETLPNNTWSVTPNHEVLIVPAQKVSEEYSNPEPEWMPAGHVSVGDYLVVPTPKVDEKDIVTGITTAEFLSELPSELHPNEKSVPKVVPASEDMGYILGQYVADGSVFGKNDNVKGSNYDHILEIAYNDEEEEYWNVFMDSWKRVFGERPKLVNRGDLSIRCQRVHAYGQRAANLIAALGGRGCHTKILHPSVMKWPIKTLKAFLKGYLRGDGHTRRHMFHGKYSTHRVNASTCSAELGMQLFWVARRCGYNPSIKFRTRSGNLEAHLGFYADDARVIGPTVQRNYEVSDDVCQRRRSSFASGDYFLARVTKAHRSLYRGKKYDLSVEGLHDYTVNGAVVHNSWNSIPWYGIERKTRRLNAIGAVTGNTPNYFLFGHFHNAATQQHTVGETIINGSWAATDEFALNSLGAYSTPFQWLLGVHPNYGVTWRMPIKLRKGTLADEAKQKGRYSITLFEDYEQDPGDFVYRERNDRKIYL